MMAQYYTKIRLGRMATLLALTEAETEDCLSDMVRNLILHYTFLSLHHKLWSLPKVELQVVAGTVSAKTDRLEGIVDFTEQQVKVVLAFLTLSEMQHDRTPWKTLTPGVTTQTS